MANATSLMRSSSKYVYLVLFFAFLSGLFHPFLTGSSFGIVIVGILVLFAGLAGGILLYKAVTLEKKPGMFVNLDDDLLSYKGGSSDNKRGIFLAGGFVLIAISLMYIYQLTGRV